KAISSPAHLPRSARRRRTSTTAPQPMHRLLLFPPTGAPRSPQPPTARSHRAEGTARALPRARTPPRCGGLLSVSRSSSPGLGAVVADHGVVTRPRSDALAVAAGSLNGRVDRRSRAERRRGAGRADREAAGRPVASPLVRPRRVTRRGV